MNVTQARPGFDRMALRVNQAFIILLIVLGYLLNLPIADHVRRGSDA